MPRQQPLRPFLGKSNHWRILKPRANSRFIIDSAICDCHNEVIGPMLVWSENSQGERFAVYASDLDGSEMLMLHRHRAEQLNRTFSYLGRLSVSVDPCNPYLELFLNWDRDNHLVLGILNFSSDRYEAFY